MNYVLSCDVPSSPTSYDIHIEKGCIQALDPLKTSLNTLDMQFAMITDDQVASLHGHSLCAQLLNCGYKGSLLSFPSGEHHKTRATKELLEDQMLDQGLGRDTCIIALGGGVVTDIAGYVAATYCRGLPLIIIPTTLLGMVDASIGGKTGINTPHGKNRIGCIYPPHKVFIDPSLLTTLPIAEIKNGMVEMIKHGWIAERAFAMHLEERVDHLLQLQSPFIEEAILESCRIKKEIVEQDEKEQGKRKILNFGHTLGHAIEQASHYSLSHGNAVALGMLMESHIAVQLGYLPEHCLKRMELTLAKYALPLQLPTYLSLDTVLQAIRWDKKSLRGEPRLVVICDIGSVLPFHGRYCTPLEDSWICETWKWMKR